MEACVSAALHSKITFLTSLVNFLQCLIATNANDQARFKVKCYFQIHICITKSLFKYKKGSKCLNGAG